MPGPILDLFIQNIMYGSPLAPLLQFNKVAVHSLPSWEAIRQPAPFDAVSYHVHDSVDNPPHTGFAGPADLFGLGNIAPDLISAPGRPYSYVIS